MIAASTIAIFIVPVLFVVITRLSYGKKQLDYLVAHHDELMEKAKKVEQQDIDPELEFEIQKSRDRDKSRTGMIANTFIKRPVTAIVISLVLIISGIICIINLAVDQYPNISPPRRLYFRFLYRSRCTDS